MKMPTTIKGYVSLLRRIECDLAPMTLRGFESLCEEDQRSICDMDTEISNTVNELKYKQKGKS